MQGNVQAKPKGRHTGSKVEGKGNLGWLFSCFAYYPRHTLIDLAITKNFNSWFSRKLAVLVCSSVVVIKYHD